ncbi:MAG: MarR family transcriptional regulator [Nocardia sp.]|nr:MarR family transcriptional regulator [Nocardia sp.]
MSAAKMGSYQDVETRELATVLRDLAWTVHRLVPQVAGLDPLPTTELAVLKQVLTAPGVTVTELARRLGMRHSNVSAAVRDLLARGLVVRRPSTEDRRVSLLMPTDKSLAEQNSIEAVWSGTVRSAMSGLNPQQVSALEAASEAMAALDHVLRSEHHT